MADAADIEAFVAVAHVASFTRAAQALGSSKSNVGKAVQRLEARLGTRLFQRTTRSVRLTEDGKTYFRAAQAALDRLRDAEQVLAARRSEPSGTVRVALPAGFGRLLFPSFKALREQYPKLAFDLAFDDRMSDPVSEGWDIVVRIGELPATGELMVRKLCKLQLGLYVAPAYRKHRGAVLSIAELDQHDAVVFRGPSGRLRPWRVLDGGRQREVALKPALVLNDGQALVEAVVNGFGIAQIHDRVAAPYVRTGVLERVLPAADVPGPPVHAIIALGTKMAPKTRAVLQHLAESLRRPLADA